VAEQQQSVVSRDHVHTKIECVEKSTMWLPGICIQARPDLLRSDLQLSHETSKFSCGSTNVKVLMLDPACTLL
jgi:hypothetical protein